MLLRFDSLLFICAFQVDQDSQWARWPSSNVTSLRQTVDFDIPREALRNYEDERHNVAIVEEAIFFLLSPFHEVRLAVVPSVVGLVAGLHHTPSWMQSMFERVSVVLRHLLVIEVKKQQHQKNLVQ